ncbi:helix-turn-helix transcriptional regulator [Anaerotruncus colihominis]|uniref:helix-turn-helix transcriptional regulator n=1 Tax=Anaerotruncus colihominis TaxID=169435 RepID=UPI001898CAFF|nr:PAS domain-containing protein [Anaerotruncus colihominis]
MIKPILAQYIPLAHMIAQTIGDDCEVVLHDLENPQQSVVYIVNNRVTGRQVGQSFDHLVPQVILSKKLDHDIVTNYYFHTADGRLIKSSTALLKDFGGKVVGALCINIDTTKISQQIEWLQSLMPGTEENAAPAEVSQEELTHVSEIVTDLIDKIIGNKDMARLRREEKLELIRFMDQRGIFLLKGAVDQVGSRMGISRVTVYSYIDEVRGKK